MFWKYVFKKTYYYYYYSIFNLKCGHNWVHLLAHNTAVHAQSLKEPKNGNGEPQIRSRWDRLSQLPIE